ncbi:MAG: M20/M25/M40 family metallo-hydrolase [Anaerolineales bacterium]|nr:M20/M25/M40 family metallo-hydrolase [Anaerolineales bacterium]
MNLERMLSNAAILQGIASPTFGEQPRAFRLQTMFEEAGVTQLKIDSAGNLLAWLTIDTPPPLIVSAHLDTVFCDQTDLTLTRNGDRLSGPGIGDNTIALAALVELAADLIANPPGADVILAANVAEEGLGNLAGMKALVDCFEHNVRAYIVLEGFSQDTLVTRALSIRRYRINIHTRGGHPWAHPDRPSAIHLLTQIAQLLLTRRRDPRSPMTVNIGRIQGGRSINTIAAEARMELDIRSANVRSLEHYEKFLFQISRQFMDRNVEIHVEPIGARPSGEVADDHPLVRSAMRALHAAGIAPVRLAIGSTDANIPLSRGYPAICMGLTRGGGAHSMEEYIEISPLKRGYAALLTLVHSLTKLDD